MNNTSYGTFLRLNKLRNISNSYFKDAWNNYDGSLSHILCLLSFYAIHEIETLEINKTEYRTLGSIVDSNKLIDNFNKNFFYSLATLDLLDPILKDQYYDLHQYILQSSDKEVVRDFAVEFLVCPTTGYRKFEYGYHFSKEIKAYLIKDIETDSINTFLKYIPERENYLDYCLKELKFVNGQETKKLSKFHYRFILDAFLQLNSDKFEYDRARVCAINSFLYSSVLGKHLSTMKYVFEEVIKNTLRLNLRRGRRR